MLKLNLAKRPCEPGNFHPIPTFLGLICFRYLKKLSLTSFKEIKKYLWRHLPHTLMPTLQHNIYQLCKLLLQNLKIYLALVLLIVLNPTSLAPYTTQNHGCCSIVLAIYKDLQ